MIIFGNSYLGGAALRLFSAFNVLNLESNVLLVLPLHLLIQCIIQPLLTLNLTLDILDAFSESVMWFVSHLGHEALKLVIVGSIVLKDSQLEACFLFYASVAGVFYIWQATMVKIRRLSAHLD